jgi:hypothetical protein
MRIRIDKAHAHLTHKTDTELSHLCTSGESLFEALTVHSVGQRSRREGLPVAPQKILQGFEGPGLQEVD